MKIRVKINEQTFEVEVGDLQARPIQAVVDGETFEVWPDEVEVTPVTAVAAAPVQAPVSTPATAPVVRPAAAPAPSGNRSKQVVAPIPGTIVSFAVKEGDTVQVGQELCTLEAMKMKNAIRSNRASTIGKIYVAPGDRVSQNQAILEFAD